MNEYGPYAIDAGLFIVLERHNARIDWVRNMDRPPGNRVAADVQGLTVTTRHDGLIDVLFSMIRQTGEGYYWEYPDEYNRTVYCIRLPVMPSVGKVLLK